MTSQRDAVDALEQLGLTEYEAKCFVALNRVPKATAKEVSQLSDVPRSRVYDVLDLLHNRGLVDVQQSEPREYRALSKDAAFEKLKRDFDETIEQADAALDGVESASTSENEGVWAIASADHVTDRMVSMIEDAEERVHLIVTGATYPEEVILDQLAGASDRGVEVIVEVPSEAAGERIDEAVPEAHIVVVERLGETVRVVEKWPAQLLMVDDQMVLGSGIEETDLPDVTEETAMWSHGKDHGFAAWIRELLTARSASPE